MERHMNEREIRANIIDLEDRLMDIIDVSSKYEKLPDFALELEMNELLRQLEHLEVFLLLIRRKTAKQKS